MKIQTELLRWINFCRVFSAELYSQEGISLYLRPRLRIVICKKVSFFLWSGKKSISLIKNIESRNIYHRQAGTGWWAKQRRNSVKLLTNLLIIL